MAELLELLAWDKSTGRSIKPERPPTDGEWARFPSGTKKTWYAPSSIVVPDMFTTTSEVVKINGNDPEAFSTVYFGINGDSITMSFDVVDDQGALQTQLDSDLLGYPPLLSLPVIKVAAGTVVDEVYFSTTLSNGVISVTGSFPASGNWQMTTARINAALGEIGATWALEKDNVTFRISS